MAGLRPGNVTDGDQPKPPAFVKQPVKRQAAGRSRDTSRIDEDQDERVLDAKTVLVVDEAGMLGSRKLTRLLDHAQDAGAKVVLVGDDKQLAAIEAGGGFRGCGCGLAPAC
jgi:ATP-dependent exoDNAse (exonuclease V) alpha subunit